MQEYENLNVLLRLVHADWYQSLERYYKRVRGESEYGDISLMATIRLQIETGFNNLLVRKLKCATCADDFWRDNIIDIANHSDHEAILAVLGK